MSKKNTSSKMNNNTNVDKGKPDNTVKVTIISGVFTIIVTLISVLIAPFVLEKTKEISPTTSQTLPVDTPQVNNTLPPQETSTTSVSNEDLLNTASTQWKQIAFDDFSTNQHEWWTDENTTNDGDYYYAAVNGKYQMDITTTDGIDTWFTSDISVPEEFYLKADMRKTQKECSSGGILWNTSIGYYAFQIADLSGEYNLFSYDQNAQEYTHIIPWRDTKHILADETNRLAVIQYKGIIKLYINEQFIGEETSTYRSNGNVGFYTNVCADNAQVTFDFDNLELRIP